MTGQLMKAQVIYRKALNDSVMQFILKPEKYVEYQAGQYLQIHLENESLSYSIANAPLGEQVYELHIRRNLDHLNNCRLFDCLMSDAEVRISLPYGACSIAQLDVHRPILFITGGTGFAHVKAMIEQLIANNVSSPFELIWGVRTLADLYLDKLAKEWTKKAASFRYFPVVDESNRKTLMPFVIKHHQNDFKDWQIVISGHFDMVYSVRDELLLQGVLAKQMFSDAFTTEPRP